MVAVKDSNLTQTTHVVVTDPKMKAFLLKLRDRKMDGLKRLDAVAKILYDGTK